MSGRPLARGAPGPRRRSRPRTTRSPPASRRSQRAVEDGADDGDPAGDAELYDRYRTKRISFMLDGVTDDVIEPAAADFQLPRILAALADPHRLPTLRHVARHGESLCAQVMQEAGLAMFQSTFSPPLRDFRQAGVRTQRPPG